MVLHGLVQVAPAARAERFIRLVTELFIQTAQQALVIYAHGLQEAHFELLAVATELGCQAIALTLQLLLRNILSFEHVESSLALDNLIIGVLVVADHAVDHDLVLGDERLQFVLFGFALPAITLVLEGDVNGVILVTQGVALVTGCALGATVSVRTVLIR